MRGSEGMIVCKRGRLPGCLPGWQAVSSLVKGAGLLGHDTAPQSVTRGLTALL